MHYKLWTNYKWKVKRPFINSSKISTYFNVITNKLLNSTNFYILNQKKMSNQFWFWFRKSTEHPKIYNSIKPVLFPFKTNHLVKNAFNNLLGATIFTSFCIRKIRVKFKLKNDIGFPKSVTYKDVIFHPIITRIFCRTRRNVNNCKAFGKLPKNKRAIAPLCRHFPFNTPTYNFFITSKKYF